MIYVCNLEEMPRHVAALRPGRLVSLVQPAALPATPPTLAPEHHLRLAIDDIEEPVPDHVLPGAEHVEALVEFARGWDRTGPLVVHCIAGISRSTAAALIVAAVHFEGHEEELARRLREAAPHAKPNRLLVRLADEVLGRRGALVRAVESMGPHEPLLLGALVELALDGLAEVSPSRPAA